MITVGGFVRIASAGVLISSLVFAGFLFAQNNDYSLDPKWKAPAASTAKRNPLAGDPKSAAQGRDIYEANCSMCHGMDGRGIANAANFHMAAVQKQTDGTLFWKMTTGNPSKGMPSFQRLPEKTRWQLVSYLRTFRSKTGGSTR